MGYYEDLLCLVNHRVTIHSNRTAYHVLISQICPNYIRAIELSTGNIKFFNFEMIDFIEESLV